MKKATLHFVAITFLISCSSLNHQAVSHEGEPILLGDVDRRGLEKGPFAEWFNSGYQTYSVDHAALENTNFEDVEILTFMGTWCSDSQREVPHFYKILDHLKISKNKHNVFALDNHPDRRKTSPKGEEKGWNIEYVPTFIFLKDGQEIGRIIESPMETLEKDMANILANN